MSLAEVRPHITYSLQSTSDIREHMLTFLENHDEQRIASDFFAADAKRALAALIVSTTIASQPFMLYAGEEFGEKGMDKEGYSGVDGRTTIFDYWSVDTLRRRRNGGKYDTQLLTDEEKQLLEYHTRLLNLCNSENALSEGQFYDLQYANPHCDKYDSNRIYSYLRGTNDELLLIVTNFGDTDQQCSVCIPNEAFAYYDIYPAEGNVNAVELLTGKSIETPFTPDTTIDINVPANNGVILKFKTK